MHISPRYTAAFMTDAQKDAWTALVFGATHATETPESVSIWIKCPECAGKGETLQEISIIRGGYQHFQDAWCECPECRGEGGLWDEVA